MADLAIDVRLQSMAALNITQSVTVASLGVLRSGAVVLETRHFWPAIVRWLGGTKNAGRLEPSGIDRVCRVDRTIRFDGEPARREEWT